MGAVVGGRHPLPLKGCIKEMGAEVPFVTLEPIALLQDTQTLRTKIPLGHTLSPAKGYLCVLDSRRGGLFGLKTEKDDKTL